MRFFDVGFGRLDLSRCFEIDEENHTVKIETTFSNPSPEARTVTFTEAISPAGEECVCI